MTPCIKIDLSKHFSVTVNKTLEQNRLVDEHFTKSRSQNRISYIRYIIYHIPYMGFKHILKSDSDFVIYMR